MLLNLKQMLSWLLSFVISFSICILYKAGKRQVICCLSVEKGKKGERVKTRERDRERLNIKIRGIKPHGDRKCNHLSIYYPNIICYSLTTTDLLGISFESYLWPPRLTM